MYVRNKHDHVYDYHHFYDVIRCVLGDYDYYFSQCDLLVCEKLARKMGSGPNATYYNPDVVAMHAYLVCAVREIYPHVKIRYVDARQVRAHWGVTVKRTKEQSKRMSLNAKRLQNKKYSWYAKLMSDTNKELARKLFTVRKKIKSGKKKGQMKTELAHDGWESAMIAMYGLSHYDELLNQTDEGYVSREPTTNDRVRRMPNVQLFDAPPVTETPKPAPKRKRNTDGEPKPKRTKTEPNKPKKERKQKKS